MLVDRQNLRLADLGEDLDLWDALYLGRGERRDAGGREKHLSNAVEAIFGAVYLDATAAGDREQTDAFTVIEQVVHGLLGL